MSVTAPLTNPRAHCFNRPSASSGYCGTVNEPRSIHSSFEVLEGVGDRRGGNGEYRPGNSVEFKFRDADDL